MARKTKRTKPKQEKQKSGNSLDIWFLLEWKRLLVLAGSWFFSVIIHNFIYALFGLEEALFFILAVFVIPIYFIISLIYTITRKYKNKEL